MKTSDINKLRNRDTWCWHCGREDTLVPHHRMNRGMGGFKPADNLQNVILVCSAYNFLMESDPAVANEARDLGHKVGKFATPTAPVFDNYTKKWYTLWTDGTKTVTDPPAYLI